MGGTGVGKNPGVPILLLQRRLKRFQLGKLNLWILFSIMTLNRYPYRCRDINRIQFSICKLRRLEIAVERHNRADFLWVGRREHERTSAAETKTGNRYAIRLSEAPRFGVAN